MSTLTAMTSNVRSDLVIDPNGDIWTDARIQRYIQEFVNMVYTWTGLDFGESSGTLPLVAGTSTYNLRTAFSTYGKFTSLRLAGRFNLLPERDYLELKDSVDLTTTGEPSCFYFYGDNTIGLWPTPDGVITTAEVLFERSGPTLTANDSPSWDEAWHHVAEKYAYKRCLETQPGMDATDAKREYLSLKSQMLDDLWERSGSTRVIQNEIITNQWPA